MACKVNTPPSAFAAFAAWRGVMGCWLRWLCARSFLVQLHRERGVLIHIHTFAYRFLLCVCMCVCVCEKLDDQNLAIKLLATRTMGPEEGLS